MTPSDQTPQEGRWQPIATAPKDGSRVLLFCPERMVGTREHTLGFQTVGIWTEYHNGDEGPAWTDFGVRSWGYEEFRELYPSHWMPLPPPPEGVR